jgi:DNA polymerase-3 subunit beta
MKFTTTAGELQRALSKVSSVVPTKSTMPILEYILFDLLNNTLVITATDVEISQTISMEVKGVEDGRIAVPSKRLLDTVRSLPDTEIAFNIDTTSQKIKLTTKNGEYNITGEDAKEFPAVPSMSKMDELTIEGSVLKKIINRTAFAVSTDELRPAMMGVLLQAKGSEMRAVATDGHRLVRFSYKLPKESVMKGDIIVPAKALNIIHKILDTGTVKIGISQTHVRFEFDSIVLVSQLIAETYPNYETVIPTENDKLLVVNREEMISTIRRVALYASATTHQIKLSLRKNKLIVSAQDIDFGGEAKETLDCEYTSDDLDIGFNSVYLTDMLTHLESESVAFKFSTPTRAGVVTPAGENVNEDVLMLVMPVRLNV